MGKKRKKTCNKKNSRKKSVAIFFFLLDDYINHVNDYIMYIFLFSAQSTETVLYLSAPGLSGGPDVPHVAPSCRTNVAEGNDVGVTKVPPVSVNNSLIDLNNSACKKTSQVTAFNIFFFFDF